MRILLGKFLKVPCCEQGKREGTLGSHTLWSRNRLRISLTHKPGRKGLVCASYSWAKAESSDVISPLRDAGRRGEQHFDKGQE